ncbi:MAG: hypothetical protein J7K04_10910 [Spirochaetales bacterium]|nr:hypothetical protein [Spirochaetales bacterium]
MPKIRELLDIKTGYADFIVLKTEYKDRARNIERMGMYRPTTGHRKAFIRLAQGLKNPQSKKFYLLSGSYGTGKSHLSLMFANYLSYSSSSPEIRGFFDNFRSVDPENSEELSRLRRNGRFLVCISDSPGGSGSFEDLILKALQAALDREGIPFNELTQFEEAIRQLENWKKQYKNGEIKADLYKLFSQTLSEKYSNMDMDRLIGDLTQKLSSGINIFNEVYKSVIGRHFSFEANNIIGIIQSILSKEEFRKRFLGIAFFYDEFQYVLENSNYDKNVIHGFMEDICQNAGNVLFVGCIHKDFKQYSDTMSRSDFDVFSDRVTQIDLTSEGIEEIINAIIKPKIEHPYWQKKKDMVENVFSPMLPTVNSLRLFPWINSIDAIKQKILFNLYPMHPMATFLLIELSSRIGSNARSTFSFFSGKVINTLEANEENFLNFIEKHEPYEKNSIVLYTANRIYLYFEKDISANNISLDENQRRYILNYQRSLEEWNKFLNTNKDVKGGSYYENILKLILLYELTGKVPSTLKNIAFGMFEVGSGKDRVKRALVRLEKARALFFRKQSETWEFISAEDIDYISKIERWIVEHTNESINLVDEIKKIVSMDRHAIELYLEAEAHNIQFTEDKRFYRKFVDAKDLGKLFSEKQSEKLKDAINEGYKFLIDGKAYEGIAVYVIAQSEQEIEMAKREVSKNSYENVVIGIPQKPTKFKDLVMHILGAEELLHGADSEGSKISVSTRSRINDYLNNEKDGYITKLKAEFSKIQRGEEMVWYWKNGKQVKLSGITQENVVDVLCNNLFNKRARIKHRNLNKRHDVKAINGKNNTFKVCVNELISSRGYIGIDSGAREDECEKDYFAKVLKNRNCLRLETREGNVEYFGPEENINNWSDDNTPMRDMFREMESKRDKGSIWVRTIIMKMLKPPYGAGLYNTIFSLAFLKWFYKDSLKIYRSENLESEIEINNYEDLSLLVRASLGNDTLDNLGNAVFVLRSITKDEIEFINGFYELISDKTVDPGSRVSFKMLKENLLNFWYQVLPAVKNAVFLEGSEKELIEKWNNLIDSINTIDPREFFISKFLPALGLDEETKIDSITSKKALDAVKKVKNIIRESKGKIEKKVLETIGSIFIENPNTVKTINSIEEWFKNLSDNQRDSSYYSEDNKNIAIALYEKIEQNPENLKRAILELIPASQEFSLGPVYQWNSNKLKDYVSLFKTAKETIDNALKEIEGPVISIKDAAVDKGTNVYELNTNGKVVVNPKNKDEKLYFKELDRGSRAYKEVKRMEIGLNDFSGREKKYEIYSQDLHGNRSKPKQIRVINKEEKYKIEEIENGELIVTKASFIIPEAKKDVKVFIKSVIDFLVERGIINGDEADRLVKKLNEAI